MSQRFLISARLALAGFLALSLAAVVGAQTPAPKADPDPDVALARTAALDWLALADAGKMDATWDEAATSFQKVQKKADWVKGLGGARPVVGKVLTRRFLNYEIRAVLPNLPPAKYITIRFSTAFEKHKDGQESVTLIRDGARGFRTMSYYLQ
jgi:hypothetical protein